MKERPILFSGPMVRAIIAGAKTQTRRAVRAGYAQECDAWAYDATRGEWEGGIAADFGRFGLGVWARCPYGVPGDRLWVRETWRLAHPDFHDEREGERLGKPMRDGRWCHYRATYDVDEGDGSPWKPSIYMPRWASRITLEVTGVRVERLRDISNEDAKAEGMERGEFRGQPMHWRNYLTKSPVDWCVDPRKSFRTLWASINGAKSWDANPWVWVVEFRRTS